MKNERLAEQLRSVLDEYGSTPVHDDFSNKLEKDDGLTRDENPQTHYCVYFAAYDPNAGEIFVGHHKKSGLWLFNGGHIDEGETMEEALIREMGEEWGFSVDLSDIGGPKLLTITEINNPTKQTCTKHYDIWYFVPVDKSGFDPDSSLLEKEFHSNEWVGVDRARELITNESTLEAVSRLERLFND